MRRKADEPGAHEVGLVRGPRGVVLDAVDLDAPAVTCHERGRVLIGDVGAPRDVAAAEHAVLADVLLGERAIVGVGEESVEQLTQVRVDGVPVETDRVVELRVVGQHARHVSDRPATVPRVPRRHSFVRAGALFVVLGLSVLSVVGRCRGCRNGDSKGPSKPPRSTRAEMVAQANAVCAAGLEEAEALRMTSDPTAHGTAAAAEVDATLAALDRQVTGLAELRGPVSTDAARESVVRRLRAAATGLEQLQRIIVKNDSTINEAVQSSNSLVRRINRSTAQANDALRKLGFLGCIGVAAG